MTELDLLVIVALLPLSAIMTLVQRNPYHALVIRGMLGAIAALVYALLGAADVALTEALVGTMLAITLYVVAVRSSLVLRLGVLASDATSNPVPNPAIVEPETENEANSDEANSDADDDPSAAIVADSPLLQDVRGLCRQHYLRLDVLPYPDRTALAAALDACDLHATAIPPEATQEEHPQASPPVPHEIAVRVPRLYDLMQAELNPAIASVRPTFATDSAPTPANTP